MKNLKDIITEKLRINKDTGKDEIIDEVEWTNQTDFDIIIRILSIEDDKFIQNFKNSSNNRGDLYWAGVHISENITQTKCEFLDRYISKLNNVHYDVHKCPKEDIADKLGYEEIGLFIYEIQNIFIIWIEGDIKNNDVYLIGANKQMIQTNYNMFINDGWETIDTSLYDLFLDK